MSDLSVERSDGVVTVTMDRTAKKNAIDSALWSDLRAAFDEVAARPEDRAVVLTGAGGNFSSGADLTDPSVAGMDGLTRMREIGEAVRAVERVPKPTIAKVEGVCMGAGMGVALACDLVVTTPDARFCQIFARRGLAIDGGSSWLLPRLVGLRKAKELAYFAEEISGTDAVAMGLANRAVPVGEIGAFVTDWARRLAGGPTIALSLTKTLLNESHGSSFEVALENEARAQAVTFGTADVVEAMSAFAQKREPKFRGA